MIMEETSLYGSPSQRLVDSFVVCGLPPKPNEYDVSEILTSAEEILLNENGCLDFTRYSVPIVDIKLVCATEEPPFGYEVLRYSYSDSCKATLKAINSDDFFICFRRGYDQPPIADIGIYAVSSNLQLKKNATFVEHASSGRPVALGKHRISSSVYLSYSRLPKDYGIDQLALTNICAIFKNKSESCPLGYKEIDMKLSHTQFSSDMNLCYKKSVVKQHIAAYQPEVLLWHHVNQSDLIETDLIELSDQTDGCDAASSDAIAANNVCTQSVQLAPESLLNDPDVDKVASFCLPWGAAIESWSVFQTPPEPVFFTFVLTKATYEHLYGSALTFYEPYDTSQLDMDKCYRLGVDPELAVQSQSLPVNINGCSEFREGENVTTEQLHQIKQKQGVFHRSIIGDRVMGTTTTFCIISQVYFGGSFKPFLNFLQQRCLGDREKTRSIPLERYLAFLLYELPFPDRHFLQISVDLDGFYLRLHTPHETSSASSVTVSEPFASLLLFLGTDLCLQLLVQLLTEQKILLISVQPDLLDQIAQALISLIYPLRWVLVYIPFIHIRCIYVIQSPSPYLIGVDSRFFEFFQLPPNECITCVDLNTRNFRLPKDNAFRDTKCLPKTPCKKLRNALLSAEKNLRKIHEVMIEESRIKANTDMKYRAKILQVCFQIKCAFLSFMADLLHGYRDYLLPVGSNDSAILFNADGYIKDMCDSSSRPFYRALFGTQLWADFVRDVTCLSERTTELEAFDTYMSVKSQQDCGNRKQQARPPIPPSQIHFADMESEHVSRVSADSGGSSNITAAGIDGARGHSGFSLSGCSSPRSSFSNIDAETVNDASMGIFCTSCRLIQCESVKVISPPPFDLSKDTISSGLDFTWTKWGNFPHKLDHAVMQQLRKRILCKQFRLTEQRHHLQPSASMLALRGTYKPTLGNIHALSASASSLNVDSPPFSFFLPALSKINSESSTDFCPLRNIIGQPPAFFVGQGVSDVLGFSKLNALLRRTIREQTDCLITANKCRQQASRLWPTYLMGEIYSLWFLLLPAYLTAIQSHVSKSESLAAGRGDDRLNCNVSGLLCTKAETLLLSSMRLLYRLKSTSVVLVDQVPHRVLLILLFEYALLDEAGFQTLCAMHLNATSYALANQLQRDLGQRVLENLEITDNYPNSNPITQRDNSVESLASDSEDTPQTSGTVERTFVPQALSTPRRSVTDSAPLPRRHVGHLSDSGPDGGLSLFLDSESCDGVAQLQNADCVQKPHQKEEFVCVNKFEASPEMGVADISDQINVTSAIDGAHERETNTAQTYSFKRNFGSLALKPLKVLASQMKSVEWISSSTALSPSPVVVPPDELPEFLRPKQSSLQQTGGKLQGYRHLFDTPKSMPRSINPWVPGESKKLRNFSFNRIRRGDPSGNAVVGSGLSNPNGSATQSIGCSTSFAGVRSVPDGLLQTSLLGLTGEENHSWLQGIRSGIQRHLPYSSPSVQRHVPWMPNQDSFTTTESTFSDSLDYNDFDGSMFEPPSWSELASELGFPPTERVCLANPISMERTTVGFARCHRRTPSGSGVNNSGRSRSSLSIPESPCLTRSLQSTALTNNVTSSRRISPSSSSPNLSLVAASELRTPALPPHTNPSTYSSKPNVSSKPPRPCSPSPPTTLNSAGAIAVELRILMTTCSVCQKCSRNVYDEEIMAEWINCEDEVTIHCPFCRHMFTPTLIVRTVAICESPNVERDVNRSSSVSPSSGRTQRRQFSHGLVEYTLPYINPSVLRKELEAFIATSGSDFMLVEALSSARLLGRNDVLLWNLVFLFYRLGLPTHLLDCYSAWLMDCQAELRRLNVESSSRHGSMTFAKALQDVVLSPTVPVWLIAKWDIFPRKGVQYQPIYRLWAKQTSSASQTASTMLSPVDASECSFDELVQMTSDALTFNNLEGAVSALLKLRRAYSTSASRPLERRGSLASLVESTSPQSERLLSTTWNSNSSLYRELYLLFIRIRGCNQIQMDEFDSMYRKLWMESINSENNQFTPADAAPGDTAIACRLLFRSLALV